MCLIGKNKEQWTTKRKKREKCADTAHRILSSDSLNGTGGNKDITEMIICTAKHHVVKIVIHVVTSRPWRPLGTATSH